MTESSPDASPPVDPQTSATQSEAVDGASTARPVSGGPALSFSHITKTYPGVVAVDDVSFEVQPGEIHGLVGENGAGKSTLMGIGAGAIAADAGAVHIDGELLDSASPDRARELGLAI